MGKPEHFSYLSAALYEASSLHLGVQLHGPILVQLMPQMGCMLHPWKVYPIQLQSGRVHWLLLLATDVNTYTLSWTYLGLGLLRR